MERKKIKAVHDFDLLKLLGTLNISKDVKKKNKKCKFCRGIVTIKNIYALFPESGDIKIVCDKKVCKCVSTSLLSMICFFIYDGLLIVYFCV